MDRKPSSFLILGAGSDLAQALAKVAAAAGCPLILAARDRPRLDALRSTLLREGGPQIETHVFDVLATGNHAAFLDQLAFLPDIVVCFIGLLGDQRLSERDFSDAELILRTNFIGPASILSEVANRMERRGYGAIVGVSSVAGDRGRADNYVYGSAKAGLTAFLSGLRQRFGQTPIRVVTVKPGLLRTRMTTGEAGLRGMLMTTPERIVPRLMAACASARGVVYLPWYWRPIMMAVRAIPEPVFRRLQANRR
jgi:short-subunit dehydrogenase